MGLKRVLGLKRQRADEKERRKREKREKKIREEREIPGLKTSSSIKKLFFLSHSATVPSYI